MKKENIHIDLDENIIEFVNEKENKDVDIKSKIYDIVYTILNLHDMDLQDVFVTIDSASKEDIKKINKEYRNIDKSTDVLSFPIYSRDEIKNIIEKKSKAFPEFELGDIVLCLDIVYEQSEKYETGVIREVLYMITHGMCHLLGYDHINEDDKIKMRAMEEKVLSIIGVSR